MKLPATPTWSGSMAINTDRTTFLNPWYQPPPVGHSSRHPEPYVKVTVITEDLITHVVINDWPLEHLPLQITNGTGVPVLFHQAGDEELEYCLLNGDSIGYAFDSPDSTSTLIVTVNKTQVMAITTVHK